VDLGSEINALIDDDRWLIDIACVKCFADVQTDALVQPIRV